MFLLCLSSAQRRGLTATFFLLSCHSSLVLLFASFYLRCANVWFGTMNNIHGALFVACRWQGSPKTLIKSRAGFFLCSALVFLVPNFLLLLLLPQCDLPKRHCATDALVPTCQPNFNTMSVYPLHAFGYRTTNTRTLPRLWPSFTCVVPYLNSFYLHGACRRTNFMASSLLST